LTAAPIENRVIFYRKMLRLHHDIPFIHSSNEIWYQMG
jgi:hypothetical protein